MTKLKIKRDIFKFSNKFIFYIFFYNFFFLYIFFHIYKCLKIYQVANIKKIKKDYKKKLVKDIKIFLRKKKKKSNNMVVNVTTISQKMENKSLFSIEKNVIE